MWIGRPQNALSEGLVKSTRVACRRAAAIASRMGAGADADTVHGSRGGNALSRVSVGMLALGRWTFTTALTRSPAPRPV